jgi:hypothetical protein
MTVETTHEPLTDPETGRPLSQKRHPGYYPGFSTLDQNGFWDDATRKVVFDRVNNVPAIRFFTPEEAATLDAVMDRILPQEDRSMDRRIPLLPMLDDRLFHNRIEGYRYEDMPSDQDAYRLAAKAFDAMGQELHGKPFHLIEARHQEEVLRSIHHAKPHAAQDLWKQMNVERFWALLVSDCCTGYYSHPWAWDEIGFGGPAYPRGYMRLEEGEPEPWEVDEQRYQWAAPADSISDVAEPYGAGLEHQTRPGMGGTH